MPRKFFKRWSPDPAKLRSKTRSRLVHWILDEPNLFHLNRHSVSVAVFVGLFICFLPIPGQIPLAALAAFIFRCNFPIALALVWISNPLTFPVIFFGAYKLGAWMLNMPPAHFTFEPSWDWLSTGFLRIWEPLVLGCLTISTLLSSLGYLLVNLMWRWHVVDRWNRRKLLRQPKNTPSDHS